MTTIRLGFTALLLAGSALAVAPGDAGAQKRQRDVISREEILASAQKDQDLYTAIRSLRPQFLEPPRGTRTMGNSITNQILVVIDGSRETGLDALKSVPANSVEEVRYLDPTKSENEFGPTANSGALVVKKFKAPKPPPKDTPPPQ
jgi:hypothetical protein